MKKISFTTIVFTGLFILSGCTAFRGQPDWVRNPQSVYPEKEYLACVGEGDTRRAAENSASANLSRIFESQIQSDERLAEHSYETTTNFERKTDYDQDINILSKQTLHNIKYAEAWTDPQGRVHAVAYMQRRSTAALYRDKITDKNKRITYLINRAESTEDILQRYALLRAAVQENTINQQLLSQLNVIHSPSVAAVSPSYAKDELRRKLAETAKNIRVHISIEGDSQRMLSASIEQMITQYGFVLDQPAVLTLSGKVSVEDTGQRKADMLFARYELTVHLNDQSGTTLVSIHEKGREGHFNMPELKIRAFRTMEKRILSECKSRLDAHFLSMVDQSDS